MRFVLAILLTLSLSSCTALTGLASDYLMNDTPDITATAQVGAENQSGTVATQVDTGDSVDNEQDVELDDITADTVTVDSSNTVADMKMDNAQAVDSVHADKVKLDSSNNNTTTYVTNVDWKIMAIVALCVMLPLMMVVFWILPAPKWVQRGHSEGKDVV